MKFKFVLIIAITYFVLTCAQRHTGCQRCPQGACLPRCTGDRNVGVSCAAAPPRTMWYYDINSRTCRQMSHLGCGGNVNRWCSLEICELRCVRTLG
ncbi:kappaPI-actitoxin-Avd3d-like [Lucilia cuprina]|uniref:kappaPI-actitoxin-Avd3d-like n=1 Tax=Lucilia cuprina TaxID=7375 RepID=UPI001F060007|nr:kappaPI-actitoxin-Avd3d-like [Lucilia cuprina]